MIATNFIQVLAQAGGADQGMGAALVSLTPFILIFVIFYFLMWRPQAKRQNELQSFLNALKSGDEIVTVGGIIGTVKSIDGKVVTLEISKGTKLKVLKSQIRGSYESLVGSSTAES